MFKIRTQPLFVCLILIAALAVAPALGYVVVLKDGSQINTQKAPERQGDKVLLILQSGVRASYSVADVDFEKTEEINQGANLGNARVLDTKTREVDDGAAEPEERRPTFTDLLGAKQAARAAAERNAPAPELEAEPEIEEPPPAAANLAKTPAGFVDLAVMRREQAENLALVGEINTYLTSQGSSAKVFQGSRPNWLLVEMEAASEGVVFKAIKDVSSCLVQMRQNHPTLEGLELYLQTGNQIRAGQFSLTPERANQLLTGKIEAPAFFLRYVEF